MTEESPLKIISNSGGTKVDFTSINEINKGYLGNFYSQNIVAGKYSKSNAKLNLKGGEENALYYS